MEAVGAEMAETETSLGVWVGITGQFENWGVIGHLGVGGTEAVGAEMADTETSHRAFPEITGQFENWGVTHRAYPGITGQFENWGVIRHLGVGGMEAIGAEMPETETRHGTGRESHVSLKTGV